MNIRHISAIEISLSPGGTRYPYNSNKQCGAVLIVSLLLLLVMTIIGITALNTTKLEQSMAGNFQTSTRAFQLAESAIPKGEDNSKPTVTESSPYEGTEDLGSSYGGAYATNVEFVGEFEAYGSSAKSYKDIYWEITGTGTISSGADTLATETVHQGVHQMVLKPGG